MNVTSQKINNISQFHSPDKQINPYATLSRIISPLARNKPYEQQKVQYSMLNKNGLSIQNSNNNFSNQDKNQFIIISSPQQSQIYSNRYSFMNDTVMHQSINKSQKNLFILPVMQSSIGQFKIMKQPSKKIHQLANTPISSFGSLDKRFKEENAVKPSPVSYSYKGFTDQILQKEDFKKDLQEQQKNYKAQFLTTFLDQSQNNIQHHQQVIGGHNLLKGYFSRFQPEKSRYAGTFIADKTKLIPQNWNKTLTFQERNVTSPGPGDYHIYKEPKNKKKKAFNSVFKSKVEKSGTTKDDLVGPGKYYKPKAKYNINNINLDQIWI